MTFDRATENYDIALVGSRKMLMLYVMFSDYLSGLKIRYWIQNWFLLFDGVTSPLEWSKTLAVEQAAVVAVLSIKNMQNEVPHSAALKTKW